MSSSTTYIRGFVDEILPLSVSFDTMLAGWPCVNQAIDSDYAEIQLLKDHVNSSIPSLQQDVFNLKVNQLTAGEVEVITNNIVQPVTKRVKELEKISLQSQSSNPEIEALKKQVAQLQTSVEAIAQSIPGTADKLDLVDQEVKSLARAIVDEPPNPLDDTKKGGKEGTEKGGKKDTEKGCNKIGGKS